MHRVCIVGAGIGAEHASGYATLPDSFAIHSICDLDAARGRRLADEYGAGFTADLNDVLADPTVDILDICLPPHLHFRACMAALDAERWLSSNGLGETETILSSTISSTKNASSKGKDVNDEDNEDDDEDLIRWAMGSGGSEL